MFRKMPDSARLAVASGVLSSFVSAGARRRPHHTARDGAGNHRHHRAAHQGRHRGGARADPRRRDGGRRGGPVPAQGQQSRRPAAVRSGCLGGKQQRLRRAVLFQSRVESRRDGLRQERRQADAGRPAGDDGRRQQSQPRHRSAECALHGDRSRRQRAHLRREHAGRCHRLHLAHGAQQRAARGVRQRRQPRPAHGTPHRRRAPRARSTGS